MAAQITSAQGKFSIELNYKKYCSVPLLSFVLAHDEPPPTNTVHACALDCLFLCTIQTKQCGYECNVDMSVIISPLARSLHDLMSLLLPQPPLILMPLDTLVNPMASRSSRSLIYVDTFYLIPQALLCLQEWMTMMMKTLPLQECMTMTLLLQECLYPPLPSRQMTTMTQMQNLITTPLTPMRSMKFSS